ncbi:hypothetical protein LTR64_008765 [Lithohypha guttulata]|uniref:uncharacterized protein n=1 Tax=Lithohypha guttulata TaxID=1690604 RepID=UPI00315C575B
MRPELLVHLDELIKELEKVDSSLPEESAKNFYNSNYGGQQNISTGDAHHSGQGDLHSYGGVGTINQYTVPSRPKPTKVTPLGLCFNSAPLIESTDFVGRTAEIHEIHEIHTILQPDEACKEQRRVVIGGIGGLGNPDCHCICTATPAELYVRPVAQRRIRVNAVLANVMKWLNRPDNPRWLLIFDNYDEPELFAIDNFCPGVGHGSIVITTRLPDLVTGKIVRVQPLQATTDSLSILETRSGRLKVQRDAGAKRLATRLGGFPLALVTAGAFLRKSTMTFEQYLDAYERKWNINPDRPLRL